MLSMSAETGNEKKKSNHSRNYKTPTGYEASEMIIDGGAGDSRQFSEYLEEWKQDNRNQEFLNQVTVDHEKMYEIVFEHVSNFFDQGKHNMQSIMDELLVPNFIALEESFFPDDYKKHFGESESSSQKVSTIQLF